VLASSSAGNATFVGTDRTRLLIDAGLSRREIFRRLADIGEDPQQLDAVLITHEHSDHISGLPVLAKSLAIPVFLTDLTAPAISWNQPQPKVEIYRAGERLSVGDIEIDTFTIPHDALDPVGFCFRSQGLKVGLVTDLGYIPESIRYHLQGTDFLILESNHDLEMLKVGPYPWVIKQRVMGRKGHLSNDTVSDFILSDLAASTRTLVLGHLSEKNNHPELARITAAQALGNRGLSTRLVVAEPRLQTEVFKL
jgi:phosphoribosyl 1,2-cyclic phosphodiesterase